MADITENMKLTYIIAVDWGTSHLRAYLCQVNSVGHLHLLETRLALGVNKCTPNFEQELLMCIAPWTKLYGKIAIYLAGQISSSIGWKETPYLPCPLKPSVIAQSCLSVEVEGHNIFVLPGVSCKTNCNYDVMRGEELQVLGWLQLDAQHNIGTHLVCLPGTHTKWVLIKEGEIKLFKTAITGELYDLLCHQSVLIQQQDCIFDQSAFIKGAKYTLESELGSFTHGLFSVRSKQLFGELTSAQACAYLSGILIGSDVRAAQNAQEWRLKSLASVAIIGAPELSQCFATVLGLQQIKSKIYNVTDTTLAGFSVIYNSL
jgi:2-dehydro-3-deoxygalactonokinase